MSVTRYDLRNICNCSIKMRENTGGGASRTKGPNYRVGTGGGGGGGGML